jgi:hypothetical protein
MTVESATLKSGPYNTDGVTKNFAATFQYLEDSDIVVTLLNTTTGATTVGVLNTDYTVTDNVAPIIGGTVTIANNAFSGIASQTGIIPAGYTITLNPSIPQLQQQSYPNAGLFPSAAVEQGLDRLTLICQELQLKTNQSLQVPITDSSAISTTIPNATLRINGGLGSFLSFSGVDGSPQVSSGAASIPVSTAMAPVVQASTLFIGAEKLLQGNIAGVAPAVSDTNVFEQWTYGVNSYAQVIYQNTNSGATASVDIVLNNNLGTSSTYYGNLGMNSSGFTGSGSLNLANAVYLTATSGDLVLGTTTNNAIHFVLNNSTTDTLKLTAGTSNLYGPSSSDSSYQTQGNLGGSGWGNATLYSASGYGWAGTFNNLPFLLRSNNTTALTIDTSQNITLAKNLTVQGGNISSNPASGDAAVNAATSSGGAFFNANGTNGYWGLIFQNSGTATAQIGSRGTSDGTISFYTTTGLTERVRITSGGHLTIGGNSFTDAGYLNINWDGTSTYGSQWSDSRSSAGTDNVLNFVRNGSQVGSITTTLTNTAFNTSSDYRVKTDWQPLTKPATDTLMKVPVYSLIFKNDPDQKRVIGLLAHELQAAMPEAVTGDKDAMETYDVTEQYEVFDTVEITDENGNVTGTEQRSRGMATRVTGQAQRMKVQQVDYSKLVTALLAMCQEQENKIIALQAANVSMEARLTALESSSVMKGA